MVPGQATAYGAFVCRVPWWGLVSSIAAPLLLIGGWTLAAGMQPMNFDVVMRTISDLAAHDTPHRWLMTGALVGVGLSHLATASALGCVSEVAASGSPRPPEISCSWWRPATWTSSPAMMARRYIFGARGSTTITLCAGRAGTPSRSPVQPRNDGLMPWLSVTGTPTSATPWRRSASVRTARQRFPPRTDARSGARVNWSRTATIEMDQVADAWKMLPIDASRVALN